MEPDELKRRVREVDARKIRERADRIDRLVAEAASRGEDSDRLFWTIVHDLEYAPRTTNHDQLVELGFPLPSLPQLSTLSPDELEACLQSVLQALSTIQVFVRGTEHLSSQSLLGHLLQTVLKEPVPDVPHVLASRQWVDLSDLTVDRAGIAPSSACDGQWRGDSR